MSFLLIKNNKTQAQRSSLSYKIEKELSKDNIIEFYLNMIEWGPGIYGAEAAARYYFDKSVSNISLSQAYFLALIIPNPKWFFTIL